MKHAITIDLDDLEELMQDYIAECWDGKKLIMPLTLSGLLAWLRKQKEGESEQTQVSTNHAGN